MIWSSRRIVGEGDGEVERDGVVVEEKGGEERTWRAVERKRPSVRERTLDLWVTVTFGWGCCCCCCCC